MSPQKENLVLFPFMGQGHIIPFLSLALKLEQQRGFSITFVNSPLNIKRLRNNLPKSSNINLVEIPFDSAKHGLSPNTETPEALPPLLSLIESTPALKPAFRTLVAELVAGEKPLCVISDVFFSWSVDVAHEFGIFHAIFNTGGGFGMASLHTMWLNLPHLESNSNATEFWLPGFPAEIDRIGLTYFREQFSNCSVDIECRSPRHRRSRSCEVKCEEVVKKIELMMKDEQGDVMRGKACKVKEIIENASFDEEGNKVSSAKAIDDFVTRFSKCGRS
ncbi:hypothetical protein BUALT_Bualt13G0031200 [Buddleja alternifolia]|uniref:Uncharacterized protein n=1 Tax=Buddleja alternifolia TaxID=168488 RepID=A0AAV6WRH8_9LAMI|nr:hypothetical protein BUALT_Bualt13G0031200 [Buddleja alternifolia]